MSLSQPTNTAVPALAENAQPVAVCGMRAPTIDQVISLMPGFVYVFDHEMQANVYANRSVGTHLGYRADEIREMGAGLLLRVILPEDIPLVSAHMARIAMLEGDAFCTLDYRVLTKEKKVLWLRSVDRVFERDADGCVLRHIGCASDITTKKEAVLRLGELNAGLEAKVVQRTQALADLNAALETRIGERTLQLEKAMGELEEITYTATHDLKVPVNNLCRLGLMLEETAQDMTPEQAEQIAWVNSCAQQLNHKIAALVRVSRIRFDEIPEIQQSDLNDAVANALKTLGPALEKSGADVSVEIPAGSVVPFCQAELESMVAALVDNAINYAEPARRLRISLCFTQEADGPTLSVADNGTGLSLPAELPKVFGLFKRAHKFPPGDGMALHCAQRRLQRFGGRISATGSRGQGVEFKVTFRKERTADGAS